VLQRPKGKEYQDSLVGKCYSTFMSKCLPDIFNSQVQRGL
jgi:hypothetical protein